MADLGGKWGAFTHPRSALPPLPLKWSQQLPLKCRLPPGCEYWRSPDKRCRPKVTPPPRSECPRPLLIRNPGPAYGQWRMCKIRPGEGVRWLKLGKFLNKSLENVTIKVWTDRGLVTLGGQSGKNGEISFFKEIRKTLFGERRI